MKDAAYTLRLNKGLKKALETAAKKDHRSVASLLQKLICDHLEREGISWEEDAKPKRGTKKK